MMYPREEVVRKKKLGLHKTSMDKVVGLCHMRPKENSKEADLVKWTDEGEDRFFVDKLYIADSETFEPLQSHVIEGGGIDKAHEGVELKLRPSFFPPGA